MIYAEQLKKEIVFDAVRSRGPGGQNVNKVSSAAMLSWSIYETKAISERDMPRVLAKLAPQITNAGLLLVRCDEFRDLERNKNRCIEKLFSILTMALHKPKKRIKTKPSRSEKIKRQDSKKAQGQKKRLRSKIDF